MSHSPTSAPAPGFAALVYSDPNCPFCYATEERLHAIGAVELVEWRGVPHAPDLPVPMVRDDRAADGDLSREVAVVRDLAPEVPIDVPAGKPSTRPAIQWAAAALTADPTAGRAFVRSLYRAVWTGGGTDLSDPAVLAALADASDLPGLDPGLDARQTATDWRVAWEATGRPGVPQLVRRDGKIVYGLADAAVLRDFLVAAA